MKKILSIMLSLVMVMALFTGCGDKKAENSSFFKEVSKMQDIKTGTSDLELAIDLKGAGVTAESDIPEQFLNGDSLTLKIKAESIAESSSKQAAKIMVQYGANDYTELTTVVLDSTKLYMNVGKIVDFVKSIDETTAAEFETYLGQLGISEYISIDIKQLCQASGVEIPDMGKASDELPKILKKFLTNADKAFAGIQGQDGDDYTLTVGSENADKVGEALVKFCEDGKLKETYTEIIDWYVDLLGADTEMGKQFAEMKDSTSEIDDAVKEVKDSKDDIVKALKDANVNVVAKFNLSGDEGSRVGKLTLDSGEIKDEKEDITGKISLTSTIKEGEASIDEMIPTEGVVDLTAMLTAAMSSLNNVTASDDDYSALY